MPRSHVVTDASYHYLWSKSHPHVLEVDPRDRVTFQVREVTSSQLTKTSTVADVAKLDDSKFYPLAGPVRVRGAEVGDALGIDVLNVETGDWGWSAIVPGLGALEEFTEPYLWVWRLGKSPWVDFKNGLRVRKRPFCGVMGVAPSTEGTTQAMPPGDHGGNLDTRHLTAGSRLLLPVWVDGGLFSVGDIHAAQGDGEVCVTAIECPGRVTLRFNLIKKAQLEAPQYFTAPERKPERHFVTIGISADLMEACKLAIRRMINTLTIHAGLSREEAYVFCSVTGDLRVHEIVDKPNWVVGFWISQSSLGPVWRKLINR
ncbi:MAG TPA: acetamidase/formamidase family protein [Terriglobales bacterium]|nr:acetamidase/formamidase family protein [Terriglobales bacterium]